MAKDIPDQLCGFILRWTDYDSFHSQLDGLNDFLAEI